MVSIYYMVSFPAFLTSLFHLLIILHRSVIHIVYILLIGYITQGSITKTLFFLIQAELVDWGADFGRICNIISIFSFNVFSVVECYMIEEAQP